MLTGNPRDIFSKVKKVYALHKAKLTVGGANYPGANHR